jgi:hypothetical protein
MPGPALGSYRKNDLCPFLPSFLHFVWRGALLRGKTPVARAIIDVLRINDPDRVTHRRLLIGLGEFPPREE